MTIAGKNFGSSGTVKFYASGGDTLLSSFPYTASTLADGSSQTVLSNLSRDTLSNVRFVQLVKGNGSNSNSNKDISNQYPFELDATPTLKLTPSNITTFPGEQIELIATYGKETANKNYYWSGTLCNATPATGANCSTTGNTLSFPVSDVFGSSSTDVSRSYTVGVAVDPNGCASSLQNSDTCQIATVKVLNKTKTDTSKYMFFYQLPGTGIINMDQLGTVAGNGSKVVDLSNLDLYQGEEKIKQLKVAASVSNDFSGTLKVKITGDQGTKTFTYNPQTKSFGDAVSFEGYTIKPKITFTGQGKVYRIMIAAAGEGQEKYLKPYIVSPDLLPSPAETAYKQGTIPFTYLTNGQCYQIATVIINKEGKPQAVVKGDCPLKAGDPGFIGVTNGSTSCADLDKLHYDGIYKDKCTP
jgi:hypothetical protein